MRDAGIGLGLSKNDHRKRRGGKVPIEPFVFFSWSSVIELFCYCTLDSNKNGSSGAGIASNTMNLG